MTTKFPQLATTPPPLPEGYSYAHLIRHPGDPVVKHIVPFEGLTTEVRKFLAFQIGAHTRDQAARTLLIQGAPGEGKSDGALVAALESDYAVAVAAANMFASESEGGATDKLDAFMAEMERYSAEHRVRLVVIINDIDQSLMSRDDKTGVTINSQLLTEKFHHLADNRHLFRNFDGSNIAFIVTVNDATNLRSSLYREGRAIWYDHVPSAEDKANIAWTILAPRTSEERALVEKLVRRFRAQPIAFWKALHFQMQAAHAERALAQGIPSTDVINKAFGRRFPLKPEIAWECAKRLRSTRVRNWLTTRRKLFSL